MARRDTLTALGELAEQTPGLSQRALRQVQAARDISLQRQIGEAPARVSVAPAAQQTATQRAFQAGQDILAQRQQAQRQAEAIRGAALAERGRLGQQRLQEQQLAQQAAQERQRLAQLQQLREEELQSRKTVLDEDIAAQARLQQLGIDRDNALQLATIKQREDLARLGRDVKSQLLDSRLQFQKDERGRQFTNERQLADWTAANSASRQEFNEKMGRMKQSYDRKILLLKQADAQIAKALEQGFIKEQGDLDFEAQKELAQLRADTREKIRREEANARNRAAMFQAGGTIIGTGVGAAFGGPAGAAVGGTVGGAVGTAAGGL